jgi:2-haloacid dehalogenase
MGEYREFRELTRAAIEFTLKQHRVQVSVDDVMASMLRIRLFPDAEAALDRFARQAKLAILSNGDPESLEKLLTSAGIRERFQWVVSAHEVRTFKPSPLVYEQLLVRTATPRDRVLFVSSNGWDAAGAARYGLRVAWVNRLNAPAEGVGGRPEFTVDDLRALADGIA